MNQFQKVIKYGAIAFAVLLIFNIFYGIYQVGLVVGKAITNYDTNGGEKFDISNFSAGAKVININTKAGKVYIKYGDVLKVESNNENIKVEQNGDVISITESKRYKFDNNSEVTLYVPKNMEFDKVIINLGGGLLDIEEIITEKFQLEVGAGKINIDSIIVTDKASIDTGAGSVNIDNAVINDLDLDTGVGKFTLNATLTGKNKVDCGIGSVNINLLDDKDNYRFKIDNGIGSVNIDGYSVKNDTKIGEGNVLLDIEGGIGSIKITFPEI